MIDLCVWRSRIGCFNASFVSKTYCGTTTNRLKELHVQKASVSVYDVTVTFVDFCFLVCVCFVLKQTAVTAVLSPYYTFEGLSTPLTRGITGNDFYNEGESERVLLHCYFTSSNSVTILLVLQFLIALRTILLSGDIEQNPGPGTKGGRQTSETGCDLENKILDKITALELNLQEQVTSILSAVERQSQSLSRLADSLKVVEEDQKAIRNTLTQFSEELARTQQSVEENKNDIIAITEKQDDRDFITSTLENEVDRLESFSRRNNIKFFGIPETDPEGEEDCEKAVKQVLTTYLPEESWSDDVVERAHRLGKRLPGNSKPRPIIAKFLRWGDAMRLMRDRKARSDMETKDLRVAQDLTRRQSAKLRDLKENGKVGYFVNGRLRIKDTPDHKQRSSQGPRPRDHVTHDVSHRSSSVSTRRPTAGRSADVTTSGESPQRNTPLREQIPVRQEETPGRTRSSSTVNARRQPGIREAWGKQSPLQKGNTGGRQK